MSTTKFRTSSASNPGIRFSITSAGSRRGSGWSGNSEDEGSTYFSARSEIEEEIPPDDISDDEPFEPIILTTGELEEQKKSEEYKTGLFGAMSVVICIVIGAGIFISPQETYTQVKSSGAALIIYASIGVHTTLGAVCFAELGTTFPVSGGDYAYIDEAFGHFLAFLYQAMANLVFLPCLNAVLGQTAGRYLLALICVSIHKKGMDPAHKFNCGLDENAQEWTEMGIGIFFIIIATVGNFFSSRYTKKLDEVFMVGKLLGCTLIIVLGIYKMIGTATSKNYKFGIPLDLKTRTVNYDCSDDTIKLPEFTTRDSTVKELLSHLKAVYYVTFSYLGWNYLNYLTKELRNPIRDLPLAVCISLPLVTGLFVMMNIGYMAVLDGRQFVCTKAMAYDTLNAVVGVEYEKEVGWIVVIFVIMAALGGLFGHMEASCKSTVVGAQNHHWPSVFQQVHVTQLSPIPAVLFQGFMSLIYVIIVGFLHPHALLMSCYCENTFSAIAVVGLVWMRFKRPGLERPIKLWIGLPIFYCVCSFLLFLVPIVDVFYEASIMKEGARAGFFIQLFVVGVPIVIICLSVLAYIICIAKRPCPKFLRKANYFLVKISRKCFRLKKQDRVDRPRKVPNPEQDDGTESLYDPNVGHPSTMTFRSTASHRLLD